ncbi:DgyrCDS14233 [Dimorphilus gyrociliatus]|uniref:DgyrCDS14233 n=1 Tax=Dimorphilus gyrociliatus TaxID=2664684 RepID=A0A7I8WD07_9ANNE|nr:DgyrCDS14233 [Dimorphilus gyrociliatus]
MALHDNEFVNSLHQQVKDIIPDPIERDELYNYLNIYKSTENIQQLIINLCKVVNCPEKLDVFNLIRPYVLPQDQYVYDLQAPIPKSGYRNIILKRINSSDSLGFTFRGGFQNSVGVYVSSVAKNSQAEEKGLKAGDEIISMNGFTIKQAVYSEIMKLATSYKEICLKIKHIGMLPVKRHAQNPIRWEYVARQEKSLSRNNASTEEICLFLYIPLDSSIGCSIASDREGEGNVTVQGIKEGSVADKVGLKKGDTILNVNGTDFEGISHSEAIVAMKGSRHLKMTICRSLESTTTGQLERSNEILSMEHKTSGKNSSDGAVETINSFEKEIVTQKPQYTGVKFNANPQELHDLEREDITEKREQLSNETQLPRKKPDRIVIPTENSNYELLPTSPVAKSYMSNERAPSFKIQKPVLLSPIGNRHSVIKEEARFDLSLLTDQLFQPTRLFTNEEISGRHVILCSVPITGSLGMTLEDRLGHVIVSNIVNGGVVDKLKKIDIGDELLGFDDYNVLKMEFEKVENLLANACTANSKEYLRLIIAKTPSSNQYYAVEM